MKIDIFLAFCDDFRNNLKGVQGILSFDTKNIKVEYTAEEQQRFKKNMLKNGMEATETIRQAQ